MKSEAVSNCLLTDTNPGDVVKCSGQEDEHCSVSIPSTGVNLAHLRYFGQSTTSFRGCFAYNEMLT